MKINEETTVSEEQVLFNTLRYEDQELVIKIMKSLLPCELNCELEEEKKIPEKIPYQFSLNYIYCNINETAKEEIDKTINHIYDKINEIIDYLKSKGE